MDTKIKKLRNKLAKQREKIAELGAQATETEQEIKKSEEEQLGYLARYAANAMSGGIDEVFELLRGLSQAKTENHENFEQDKEGEIVDEIEENEV